MLWGIAIDSERDSQRVYVPNGFFDPKSPDASGGMAAIGLSDGRAIWSVANPPCGDRKACKQSHPAAVTAIPGVVFSGTMDGRLRAYAVQDGKVLWEYDTARDFATVNGVKANGGSMSNSGPSTDPACRALRHCSSASILSANPAMSRRPVTPFASDN